MTPKTMQQEPDRYALTPASMTADALMTAFEAVEVGQPYADTEQPAARHVAALAASAVACLFPAFVPASGDVLAAFNFYEADFLRSQYGRRMAELHAACRDLQPGLDAFLRSGVICARVGAAALQAALPPAEMDKASDLAVTDYQRAITGQLIGVAGFEPSASILAVIVPALQARLDACRQRHAEYIANETARMEQARRDADAAIVDAERRHRKELAEYFNTHHGRTFVVRGQAVLGSALAKIARGDGGVYDVAGERAFFSVGELAAARDATLAAVGRQ
jgi:hypothetical protein